MAEEKFAFKAEVSKLLDIVAHSLYSNKEIFLRELISNASDACDKLRYRVLTEPSLKGQTEEFNIVITPDKNARTLTVADNGIGMSRDDLVDNLGTIARSGTASFVEQLQSDAKKDISLIGQFGVGFYSAFMVADKVEVFSKKAGEEQGWVWVSSGKGSFDVKPAGDIPHGTRIVLHLKKEEDEFLDPFRLENVIKTYSDHIALPVILIAPPADAKEGEPAEPVSRTINSASALWTRSKNDVTPEQYKEFYHHVAHAFDDPWMTIHYRAEGAIEYQALLFIPTSKPFDLFAPERKQHVKLYVRRIFITDDSEDLLPPYMRFVRGVVDCQDLPLNLSREMLQHNPLMAKIKTGLTKRILSDLKKKAADAPDEYKTFWQSFGAVLKEGIYEDFDRRDDLLDLCLFSSTASDKPTSLADYVSRMKEGQDSIYFITGDDEASLRKSPQLEGFAARGVEVLLLTDAVDDFWTGIIRNYKEKTLRSAAQGAADLSSIKKVETEDKSPENEIAGDDMAKLIDAFKKTLGEDVKDVRPSERLTESAVCLVADDGDMGLHMERLMRQHQNANFRAPRILEINPGHALIRHLAELAKSDDSTLADRIWLLLDQARIIEGEPVSDPKAFAQRLASMLERA